MIRGLLAAISSLSSALRSGGDLSAEDDQVDLFRLEPAGDVGEVVGRLSLVAEVAEAGDRLVEDELALADQQHAALGVVALTAQLERLQRVVGCHGDSSFGRAVE
jgi:hypothetical protein